MEPTSFELEAYVYAIESFRDHERYGKPYEGARKISRISGSSR